MNAAKSNSFAMPQGWLSNRIRTLVVGCGGTGGEVVDGLSQMSVALRKLGHPGLQLFLCDGDTVSRSNVGRQRFSEADVGKNKAVVLATRYALEYGVEIQASDNHLKVDQTTAERLSEFELIVTCVDKASVRAAIGQRCAGVESDSLWLDFGNAESTGQVIIGHLGKPANGPRLPNVADLFPRLSEVDDDDAPSCGLAEALASQALGVNRAVCVAGLYSILMPLIRNGSIEFHGVQVDMGRATQSPIPIDELTWSMYGYNGGSDWSCATD